MRAVDVVKEKRNQLKNDLAKFMDAKNEKYSTTKRAMDLDGYERHEFSYIIGCITDLRTQINTLEFVLNEDTELRDCTIAYATQRDLGITKEKVFKIGNEGRWKIWDSF